jgi:hypothetical protein
MSGREPPFEDGSGARFHWTGRIRATRAGDVAANTACLIQPWRVGRREPIAPVVIHVTEENAASVGVALILAPGEVEKADGLAEALRGERGPLPGDVVRVRVRVRGDGHYAARNGELAVVDGAGSLARPGEVMVTLKASAFRGPASPYDEGRVIVDNSGGPCPIIPVTDLRPTGESLDHWFWRWRCSPQADGGVYYRVRVPVWEWEPDE